MFRTNIIILVSLICVFVCAGTTAQEGTLLTQFDYTFTYGMELLYNDANDDLLLLYVFATYDRGSGDVIKTELRIVQLQRNDPDKYLPIQERTFFETTRQIEQLDWTYDPSSQQYLIAFLDGEEFGEERDMRLALLDPTGAAVGDVRTLASNTLILTFPQVCSVPAKTTGAPKQARFLFLGRGWNSAKKETGLVTVFLKANGSPIGQVEYSLKEEVVNGHKPLYEPMQLLPSGDKKGFVLACERRQRSDTQFLPALVRFSGNAKYTKHVTMGTEKVLYNSISMHQVSKKKFAVAWVDDATLRYWTAIVPATAKKAKAPKLVSEMPSCTDDFDDPYLRFAKPDGAKKATLFCVGDRSDPTVYSLLLKKNGKTSNLQSVEPWSSMGDEVHHHMYRWFAVAPIRATNDFFCAIVLRRNEGLEVYGYFVKGN